MVSWLCGLLIACNTPKAEKTLQVDDSALDEGMVQISQAQFEDARMATGKMSYREFPVSIAVNGVVDVPPDRRAVVSAYFGGYVKQIELLPGQQVKKGQRLFVLENPDYIQIQQDYLEAKGQLIFLQSDYDRQKSLAEENVTSKKTLIKAESDFVVMRARFESLRKKLAMMNFDPDQVSESNLRATINVISPISGYVTDVRAAQGMFLNPADEALTLTNTEHIHLELSVFEKDLSLVKVGLPIVFSMHSANDKVYRAKVYLINKMIDPDKRTANIHAHLDDESISYLFTPGMFVEAEILTATTSAPALPQEAVVNVEGANYVLLKKTGRTGEWVFEKRSVRVGNTHEGFIQILSATDFKPEDEFLVKEAFSLVSE